MKTLSRLLLVLALTLSGAAAVAQGITLPEPFHADLETLRVESARPRWHAGSPLAPKSDAAYASSPDPYTGEIASGIYQPLSDRLSTLMETSHASGRGPTQEWSMLGQVAASLGDGWGVRAGLRHSELGLGELPLHAPGLGASASADLGMLTLERSWHRYRGAYTYYTGRSDTGALASGHRVQLNYFYAERSSVGLAYTSSQQVESLGALPLAGAPEVANVGVTGEHWLSGAWSVNYNALIEDGGAEGLKPELRLGLRVRF